MKTLLVTGDCGFIGSHFVRQSLRHSDRRIVNLDGLTYAGRGDNLSGIAEGPCYRFVEGDIRDRAFVDRLLQEERPWGVVNFAAESHVDRSILDPAPFVATNVGGVQVLLEGARAYDVERFVQVSTDEVYGDATGVQAFAEDSRLAPSSPYAATKAAADMLCLAYVRTHGLPVVIVRPSNNYGPCQFPEKLIPLMIRNALTGDSLPVYGDGLQLRDWLYVEDNVHAILAILEHGRPGAVYNVATGEERTNLDVVRSVCRFLGGASDSLAARIRHVTDRPGHDRRYAVDTRRMRSELGWVPRVAFETGLERTVRWYLEHTAWIERLTSEDYRTYYDAVYTHSWKPHS